MSLSLGKIRRMQQCATVGGQLVIAAMDHRGNLRRTLNAADPASVPYMDMVTFKRDVVGALSPASSAVLVDPEFGAGQVVVSQSLRGDTGFVVAVEATGYEGDPTERKSRILDGWSVEKISRMGASAVKLLLYYHPDAPNAAAQEELVKEVGALCTQYEMPFFFEPLSFSLEAGVKKLGSAEKRRVVIETARRLTPHGVDVLKAEFPVNFVEQTDRTVWADACAELNSVCNVPWVILSAGVNFADFAEQTTIACQAGASGIMVGRAVWKEAGELTGTARRQFLQTTGVERMQELTAICAEYGRPWHDHFADFSSTATEDWYKGY